MEPIGLNVMEGKQSYRQDIFQFAARQYGTQPEYLWKSTPDAAILRHADNRKWYALIMSVPRNKLGLSGEDSVDILNVKCDPVLNASLQSENGFCPAYHMNKENWLTALLDSTVEKETLFSLLEASFELTKGR